MRVKQSQLLKSL